MKDKSIYLVIILICICLVLLSGTLILNKIQIKNINNVINEIIFEKEYQEYILLDNINQ